MLQKIISVYTYLFARAPFVKFNKFLFRLSLSGLGILNYKTSKVSGEKSFLEKYLEGKIGILLDIGANQGNYALEAIGINHNIKVFAFEPHPTTFSSLADNVSSYPNIVPINKGMSSEEGFLQLYDYPSRDGSSHASLFQDVITETHGAGTAVSHEVALTTLDGWMQSENISEIDSP